MSVSEMPRTDEPYVLRLLERIATLERENSRLREERDKALVAVRDFVEYERPAGMLEKHAEIIALANKEQKDG